jgi:hypothetical protein
MLCRALHRLLRACGACDDGAQPNGRIGRWQAVFTLIYVLELVARMYAKGFTKAIMMRKRRLDMVMVLISIVSLVRHARARGWCCGRQ